MVTIASRGGVRHFQRQTAVTTLHPQTTQSKRSILGRAAQMTYYRLYQSLRNPVLLPEVVHSFF